MQSIRFDCNILAKNYKGRKREEVILLLQSIMMNRIAFLNMPKVRISWDFVMFDRVPKCISLIIIMSAAGIFYGGTQNYWLLFAYIKSFCQDFIYAKVLTTWKNLENLEFLENFQRIFFYLQEN